MIAVMAAAGHAPSSVRESRVRGARCETHRHVPRGSSRHLAFSDLGHRGSAVGGCEASPRPRIFEAKPRMFRHARAVSGILELHATLMLRHDAAVVVAWEIRSEWRCSPDRFASLRERGRGLVVPSPWRWRRRAPPWCCWSATPKRSKAVAGEIRAAGGECRSYQLDITDYDRYREVIAAYAPPCSARSIRWSTTRRSTHPPAPS